MLVLWMILYLHSFTLMRTEERFWGKECFHINYAADCGMGAGKNLSNRGFQEAAAQL